MKIKKLELYGFKSFVDRTILHFDQDVFAIVGPNGCGKSNIVDAIRWCMGEQSARHLRGRSMEDVIFNDSEYLINKTPVRLRDVTDLFLGTGAGTKAYSIVEQGKVGLIVSAKPEDRRLIIEEAAGITKYKARKRQ